MKASKPIRSFLYDLSLKDLQRRGAAGPLPSLQVRDLNQFDVYLAELQERITRDR